MPQAHRQFLPMSALAAALVAAAVAGCAMGGAPGASAVAEMRPTANQTAAGTITLQQRGDMVQVKARITGLTPNQQHGIHVHEKGDCSAPDGSSAGAHLNPTAMAHGMPDADHAHHAGDLLALKADASGKVDATYEVRGTLTGSDAGAFMGKAIIIHANADDYMTQPTGNSGGRIACGVVR